MILFNKALVTGREKEYLDKVFASREFCGGGNYGKLAAQWLEQLIGCRTALLTSNCTAALEIIASLLHLSPGDEIIFPAFTHVATVNPFVKAGAVPVWADIRPDTLNLDEQLVAGLLTPRTKALVAMHYAGVACDLGYLKEFCTKHRLILIEDAAQGIGASYNNLPLGSSRDLAAISFHQTKNLHCGEGGALLINNPAFLPEARLIRDRGTDRAEFDRGRVNKYTWQVNGSNYLLSELQAAFLYAQMQNLPEVTAHRRQLWQAYLEAFSAFLPGEMLPQPPVECRHNGHCFYLLTAKPAHRTALIRHLHSHGVEAVFHYQPLHRAPYWKNAFAETSLPVTERVCDTILRLPMHFDLQLEDVRYIADQVKAFYQNISPATMVLT